MAAREHRTVLREEAAALLAPAPGRRVLDGTVGGGGHAETLLERGAEVIGLDRDEAALAAARARLSRFGEKFTAVHANFRDARRTLDALGEGAMDGALVDLGVSSFQLDDEARGFSFSRPGPLDMRMDRSAGEPLSAWLDRVEETELERVLRVFGEERFARPIARAIVRARQAGALPDTAALAKVVTEAIPAAHRGGPIHPATRTFQALRIAVNDELGALEGWLADLPDLVRPGGRAAAIAFHSLEDRPVKRRFAELTKGCICPRALPVCGCGKTAGWRLLTRKAWVPSVAEVARNPRARSARLRCIERL